MNNLICTLLLGLVFIPFSKQKTIPPSTTKTIVGTWISIDDLTGEERSHIKIYKAKNGLYYGKLIKLLFKPEGQENPKCTRCPKDDYRYNQPIIGAVLLTQLEGSKDLKSAKKGKVLDPESGYIVDCQVELDDDNDDILKVRGYWKIVSIGRTQTWKRLE